MLIRYLHLTCSLCLIIPVVLHPQFPACLWTQASFRVVGLSEAPEEHFPGGLYLACVACFPAGFCLLDLTLRKVKWMLHIQQHFVLLETICRPISAHWDTMRKLSQRDVGVAQVAVGKFAVKVESLLFLVCLLWFKNISERTVWLLSLHTVRSSGLKGVGTLEAATLTRVRSRKRSRLSQEVPKPGQQDPFNVTEECSSRSKRETSLVE